MTKRNTKTNAIKKIFTKFAAPNGGTIAQLVEQRTENPCVPGSIPGGTTLESATYEEILWVAFFVVFGKDLASLQLPENNNQNTQIQ